MATIEIGPETEGANHWRYQARVVERDRSYDFDVTLGWSDYDLWCHGRAAPSEVVRAAAGEHRPRTAQKGIRLDVDLPHGPCRVRTDPVRFRQIVDHLVSNAVNATATGGVGVNLAPALRADGRADVDLVVSDTGQGIPEEQHARIFELFHRLHGRGKYEGTGIGLSLCKKIVEGHGGRIGVESQPGTGSCFWFTVPDELPGEADGNQTGGYAALPG